MNVQLATLACMARPDLGAQQILGAVVGALLEAALVPGLTWAWFGHHNKEAAPGCFYPGAGVNNYELLLWELVLTFVLVRATTFTADDNTGVCWCGIWREKYRLLYPHSCKNLE